MERSPQYSFWKKAMEEEYDNLNFREVWFLTPLPLNKQVLGSRWVYNVKRDETGKIVRYKARLVAQGYTQIKGESYEETFSPVVNFSVIRLFFSLLVVWLGWQHLQCDVTGAYLYAPLSEEVYMKQPQGFVQLGKENFVCRLKRALYGLHQSGRAWYFELTKILGEIGLNKVNSCNCTYYCGNSVIILIYVDDMVIFGRTKNDIDKIVNKLKQKFDLKVLGKTKRLLGVEFEECNNNFSIHQIPYIEEICKKYEHLNFPITSLPIAKGMQYSKRQCPQTSEESECMNNIPYRNVLGCLSFLASRTRPDISYAVNIFSQFQNNPGMEHWNGLLKLLGYVSKTRNFKLKLECVGSGLIGFSDADFAANRDDRISMGGQFIRIGNAPVTWRTFKEKSVSLSTMEAEFISMVESIKELTWLDNIVNECSKYLKFVHNEKPILLADNQAAIDFLKSPIENYRTKHIEVRYHHVRELFYKNAFEVKFVRSKSNLSDVFTKPLSQFELRNFIENVFVKE